MNEPTGFTDLSARAVRELEVPNGVFSDGGNLVASNSSGIGVATNNPNLEQQLPNWTLLDQAELTRTPQLGSQIGGIGLNDGAPGTGTEPIYVAQNLGNGTATTLGGATLETLEEGWRIGSSSIEVLLGDNIRHITVPEILVPDGDDYTVDTMWRRQLAPSGAAVDALGGTRSIGRLLAFNDSPSEVVFWSGATNQFANAFDGQVSPYIEATAIGEDVRVTLVMRYIDAQPGLKLYINDVRFGSNAGNGTGDWSCVSLYGNATDVAGIIPVASAMWNVSITNNTTGEAWKYPINEGSGATILCYDENDDPKPSFNGTVTPDAAWGTF
jgi:hypothetical protein